MDVIEITNLTKTYGRARGITDLTLRVPRGGCFGFIGPNGAGKSTTIRTLLGLISPTAGSARVLGLDCMRERTAILSRVGYMPSEAMFYPEMRAREVIRLSADLRKQNCRKEAEVLCEALDLDVGKKIRELSLGSRKKVSIVCAMQHRPELYILDEPTSGLDPLVQRVFWSELEQRQREGATVFLSSHVLYEVQRYCARAAIIREGRLVIEGTTSELDIENRFFDYYEGRAGQ